MTSFRNSICERCCKHVTEHGIHTCTPTNGWRKMEAELETLRQQRDELIKALETIAGANECVGSTVPLIQIASNALAKVKGRP